MRDQITAAENAERHTADRDDEIRKELEEPLMRGLTRGPDGLTTQEVIELVQDDELVAETAKYIKLCFALKKDKLRSYLSVLPLSIR